jgi:hypothetical protein
MLKLQNDLWCEVHTAGMANAMAVAAAAKLADESVEAMRMRCWPEEDTALGDLAKRLADDLREGLAPNRVTPPDSGVAESSTSLSED